MIFGSNQKLLMARSGLIATNIEFVGFAYNDDQSNTIVFGSSAISGVQAGDILIVSGTDDLSANFNLPSGWTSGFNFNAFKGTSAQFLFYKTASSSDTSVTISRGSSSNNKNNAVLMAFRGCAVGNIVTSSPTLSNDPPSVSVSSGSIVLAGFGYEDETTTPTVSPPAGYNDIGNFNSITFSPSSRQQGLALAYSNGLRSGAENPNSFATTGSSANFFYSFSVELTPS
jgi:hypothetical protein